MHVPEGSVVEWVDLPATGPGLLDGVTVAAKEVFDIAGLARRTGSDVVPEGTVPADAEAVRRLRSAGARITCRSASHEFAWGVTNRRADGTGTENPLLPGRVSGGSSGGSAALVAAGAVDLGLGSDTAGSARIPAAFCGVLGWKASNGSVPLDGCMPLAPRFDCVGAMAGSVALLQRAATALGIVVSRGWSTSTPRIAVLDPGAWATHDAARASALEVFAERVGASEQAALSNPSEVFDTFGVLQSVDVLGAHRNVLGTWPGRAADYPVFVAERLRAAEQLGEDRVADAEAALGSLLGAATLMWARFDVVLSVLPCGPSSITSPDVIDTPNGERPLREVLVPWTCLANMIGAPAVVAPIGIDPTGAPIVMQLMSRPGSDAALLALLGAYVASG